MAVRGLSGSLYGPIKGWVKPYTLTPEREKRDL